MKRANFADRLSRSILWGLLILFCLQPAAGAEPTRAAVFAFAAYAGGVEQRLAQQHQGGEAFLAVVTGPSAQTDQTNGRLRRGELLIDRLTPPAGISANGALLHHWRGTAFVAGATAADFERLLKDVPAYPRRFSPQVLDAKVLAGQGDHLQEWMRVRQQHIITVVMDTTYDITFGELDPRHGYSTSRSTRIAEVAGAGTPTEHVLQASEEHGFLWRLNTYWTYEERDGGLYLQVESVSLSRSIPHGLGWAVGPFVESVPRDSLEFTLRSACNALRR